MKLINYVFNLILNLKQLFELHTTNVNQSIKTGLREETKLFFGVGRQIFQHFNKCRAA